MIWIHGRCPGLQKWAQAFRLDHFQKIHMKMFSSWNFIFLPFFVFLMITVFFLCLSPQAIRLGVRKLALREHPHLILAIEDFYFDHLEKPLRNWLYESYLKNHAATKALSQSDVMKALEHESQSESSPEAELPELLFLSREWLKQILPFVLSKVNRVHYGLLRHKDVLDLTMRGYAPTGTRLQVAVPFTGTPNGRVGRGLYEAKKALQYSIQNGTSQDGTCQFSESSDCKDDKKINILGRVASFFASILLENTYSTQRYAACISLISLIQFKCNWCWESEREGFLQNRNEQSWTSQTCKKLIESWSKLLWKGLETPSLASEFAKASVQSKLSNTLRWLPHSVTVNSDAISASNLHILKFDMLFCSTFSQPGQSWCGHWVLHLVALRSCWVFQAGPWPHATPLPRLASKFVVSDMSWERGPLWKPDDMASLTCIQNVWTSQLPNAQNNVQCP